jgi:hypothetical protein
MPNPKNRKKGKLALINDDSKGQYKTINQTELGERKAASDTFRKNHKF